jgi:hypothetical protein
MAVFAKTQAQELGVDAGLVAIWDFQSRGTRDMIERAKAHGLYWKIWNQNGHLCGHGVGMETHFSIFKQA